MADNKTVASKPAEDEIVIDDSVVAAAKAGKKAAVSPPKSGWKNDEQAKYANIINLAVYDNPVKFETKKERLLANLKKIGEDASLYYTLTGTTRGGEVIKTEIKAGIPA